MIQNLYFLVKVILLLAILAFNGGLAAIIFYTESKKDCKCGPKWQRDLIKYGSLCVCGVALVAYLTPFIKLFRMIPLLGGLILLAAAGLIGVLLYFTRIYMKRINDKECACKLADRYSAHFKILNKIFGYGTMTTLVVSAVVLVVVLFYLF